MKKPLKISFLGGLGCGKTSIFASVVDELKNGIVKKYLNVTDINHPYDAEVLDEKIRSLKNTFHEFGGTSKRFILNQGPTSNIAEYHYNFADVRNQISQEINFVDFIPFSYCDLHYNQLQEIAEQSDGYYSRCKYSFHHGTM